MMCFLGAIYSSISPIKPHVSATVSHAADDSKSSQGKTSFNLYIVSFGLTVYVTGHHVHGPSPGCCQRANMNSSPTSKASVCRSSWEEGNSRPLEKASPSSATDWWTPETTGQTVSEDPIADWTETWRALETCVCEDAPEAPVAQWTPSGLNAKLTPLPLLRPSEAMKTSKTAQAVHDGELERPTTELKAFSGTCESLRSDIGHEAQVTAQVHSLASASLGGGCYDKSVFEIQPQKNIFVP